MQLLYTSHKIYSHFCFNLERGGEQFDLEINRFSDAPRFNLCSIWFYINFCPNLETRFLQIRQKVTSLKVLFFCSTVSGALNTMSIIAGQVLMVECLKMLG